MLQKSVVFVSSKEITFFIFFSLVVINERGREAYDSSELNYYYKYEKNWSKGNKLYTSLKLRSLSGCGCVLIRNEGFNVDLLGRGAVLPWRPVPLLAGSTCLVRGSSRR